MTVGTQVDVETILQMRVAPPPDKGDAHVRAETEQFARDSAARGQLMVDLIHEVTSGAHGLYLLEVGSSPYVITRYLLAGLSAVHLVAVDHPEVLWPGPPAPAEQRRLTIKMSDSLILEVSHYLLNAERDRFPFENATFDVVLCTETLEHLLFSPTHLLCEVHRVLRPGGFLLLTVPNSLNLKYLAVQLLNLSGGHAYTGYGVYGGHRREYSLWEVRDLLTGVGFVVVRAFTVNVAVPTSGRRAFLKRLIAAITNFPLPYLSNKRDTVVALARATGPPRPYYPSWLYQKVHVEWMRKAYPDFDGPWLELREQNVE